MATRMPPVDAPPPPADFAPAPKPRRPPSTPVDFAMENTRQLRDLWASKRPGRGGLPAYGAFDPLELRPWEANLALYAVEYEGTQINYRFLKVGKGVAAIDGGDFTGRYMHQAMPMSRLWTVIGHYDAAVRTRGPVEFHDTIPGPQGGAVKWDKLILPLAGDEEGLTHLLMLLYAEKVR